MGHAVTVQTVGVRRLAAVRRRARVGEIARVWKPALDLVWQFLRARPGVRADGHNVFLYHHPSGPGADMEVDFGVEVARAFVGEGEVGPAETPAGEVAAVTHVGPYDRLGEAHAAVHAWCTAHGRAFAGLSWEIYGDWSEDPAKLVTEVQYLLKPSPRA
jgi:effector-binding domain-containing protein